MGDDVTNTRGFGGNLGTLRFYLGFSLARKGKHGELKSAIINMGSW